MSMDVTCIRTWWTADQAEVVIEFIDQLRDQLCNTYGEQIQEMHQFDLELAKKDSRQGELDLTGGHINF